MDTLATSAKQSHPARQTKSLTRVYIYVFAYLFCVYNPPSTSGCKASEKSIFLEELGAVRCEDE